MASLDDEIDASELALYEQSDSEDDAPAKQVHVPKPEDHHVGFHSAGFKDFLLKPELIRAIVDSGFEHPSEVQHQCIPQAILGIDVLCQAKSGMGKTAVFVLSVLQQLDATPQPGSVVVLCHARELAYQIRCEFDRFIKYLPGIKTAVFYGGVPVAEDKQLLRTEAPHIIVGTPGRMLELAESRSLPLKNLKHFVLDECDHMLEQLSMRQAVQGIFKLTPRDKQVMMFSATLPDEIRVVSKKFMHDPLEIYVNEGSQLTLHGLQQYSVALEEKDKNRKLIDLLDALEFNQLVVFVSSVSRAVELTKLLVECNFPSSCLHSGMKQAERIETYKKFKEFKTRIMVATNLIGRGIDIERVNVVINYDMPTNAQLYLHRVARAGRFGTKGLAISFVSSASDKQVLAEVQSYFAVQIPQLPDEIDASSYMGA